MGNRPLWKAFAFKEVGLDGEKETFYVLHYSFLSRLRAPNRFEYRDYVVSATEASSRAAFMQKLDIVRGHNTEIITDRLPSLRWPKRNVYREPLGNAA